MPFGEEHLDATLRWLESAELRSAIDMREAPTPEQHRAVWAQRMGDPAREDYAVLAGSEHVGNGGLVMSATGQAAELWLYLGGGRGHGVGSAAGALLVERALGELGLERAEVRVLDSNPGAARFWRRLGFVRLARAPSAPRDEEGSVRLTMSRRTER